MYLPRFLQGGPAFFTLDLRETGRLYARGLGAQALSLCAHKDGVAAQDLEEFMIENTSNANPIHGRRRKEEKREAEGMKTADIWQTSCVSASSSCNDAQWQWVEGCGEKNLGSFENMVYMRPNSYRMPANYLGYCEDRKRRTYAAVRPFNTPRMLEQGPSTTSSTQLVFDHLAVRRTFHFKKSSGEACTCCRISLSSEARVNGSGSCWRIVA